MAVVKEPEVLAPEAEESGEVVGRGRLVWRRFLRRKLAIAGLVVLVSLFVLAFAGPHLTKWKTFDQDLDNALQGPSLRHYFGTTQLGQDVFVRTMQGLQKSLAIGLLTAFFSTGTAAVVGASAGYFGGWVDRILMWIVDLLLVLPSFMILAILSPHFRGKTWLLFVLLLAAFSWMITARIVRGLTLSLGKETSRSPTSRTAAPVAGPAVPVPAPVVVIGASAGPDRGGVGVEGVA